MKARGSPTTYGNEHVDPDEADQPLISTTRSGPNAMRAWLTCYRACLTHKRPTYSISTVQDADGKDVSYERLLLPFGSGDAVEQIVGSYKAISIEGGFKINNLMGLRPKAEPVIWSGPSSTATSCRARPTRVHPTTSSSSS